MDYDRLLASYRNLWSNRTLPLVNNSETTLEEAIKKELLDEMTHPRLRQRPEVKFVLALKRIFSSSLSDREKLDLIELHTKLFDRVLKKEDS
jgi:hypothetical protein